MIRAFYTAASGMVAQTVRQDVIANNIANAQTAGFKRQRVQSASFAQALQQKVSEVKDTDRPPYPDSPVQPVLVSADARLDLSEGVIANTGGALDFAISGPGSFEVASPQGNRLTRGGAFRTDSAGDLCTADGGKVQGNSGNIHVPKGKLEVRPDGAVIVDGTEIDKIKINGEKPGETTVVQGALEQANVNIVREMTDMILNMRSFEANQKVLGDVDRSLDKLINEVGRV